MSRAMTIALAMSALLWVSLYAKSSVIRVLLKVPSSMTASGMMLL